MKEIKKFENIETGKNFKDLGISPTMYWAYQNSKEFGHDIIDFKDVIWEKDIKEIVSTCRENEVEKITISSTFSGLIPILAEFEKLGCKINGMTEIKSSSIDFATGKNKVIPAIIVKM